MKELFIILAAGLLGGLAGMKMKVPGGILIGAMVAVIAVKWLGKINYSASDNFVFIVQVIVGVMVGLKYTPETAGMAHKLILPIITSTLVLVGTGLILSLAFTRVFSFDPVTSYMATSPGAMSSLIPLAAETEAEAALVAAFHFFRLVFIILTAPLVLKLIHFILNRPH